MMFDRGNDDFIALLHAGVAETGGYQVQSFGGATRKDNLRRAAGIDESADGLTGTFVQFGGLLAEPMHAPMDVGIDIEVLVAHGIEHTQRLLRSGRIVEINQRLAVDRAGQDGEVSPDQFYIHR